MLNCNFEIGDIGILMIKVNIKGKEKELLKVPFRKKDYDIISSIVI